jgi:hypothetical protein
VLVMPTFRVMSAFIVTPDTPKLGRRTSVILRRCLLCLRTFDIKMLGSGGFPHLLERRPSQITKYRNL